MSRSGTILINGALARQWHTPSHLRQKRLVSQGQIRSSTKAGRRMSGADTNSTDDTNLPLQFPEPCTCQLLFFHFSNQSQSERRARGAYARGRAMADWGHWCHRCQAGPRAKVEDEGR